MGASKTYRLGQVWCKKIKFEITHVGYIQMIEACSAVISFLFTYCRKFNTRSTYVVVLKTEEKKY